MGLIREGQGGSRGGGGEIGASARAQGREPVRVYVVADVGCDGLRVRGLRGEGGEKHGQFERRRGRAHAGKADGRQPKHV